MIEIPSFSTPLGWAAVLLVHWTVSADFSGSSITKVVADAELTEAVKSTVATSKNNVFSRLNTLVSRQPGASLCFDDGI